MLREKSARMRRKKFTNVKCANVLLEKEFLFYFRREVIWVQYSLCLIDLSLFCVLIRFENIIRPCDEIRSCDSVSDTFDRPSWYINRIGEREGDYSCVFKNPQTNSEGERRKDRLRCDDYTDLPVLYKCYRGPEGCVYLLRVFWAAVVTRQ